MSGSRADGANPQAAPTMGGPLSPQIPTQYTSMLSPGAASSPTQYTDMFSQGAPNTPISPTATGGK